MSSNQPTESGRVSIRPASAKDAPWETVVLFEARDELLGLPELERQIRLNEAGVSCDLPLDAKVSVETLGRTLLLAVGSETDHTTLLAELRPAKPVLSRASGK